MEELEQPEVMGSKQEFGKFKDAESLLKAYNNLESEFTKKSQRLATRENENNELVKKETKLAEVDKRVEEFVTKFDAVKPFSSALKASLNENENMSLEEEAIRLMSSSYKKAEDYAVDEEFLNNYIFSNDEIKNKIVKDYLSKVTQNSPIKINSSSIPLTPPRVPTTIEEAGKLAKSIIKQK